MSGFSHALFSNNLLAWVSLATPDVTPHTPLITFFVGRTASAILSPQNSLALLRSKPPSCSLRLPLLMPPHRYSN